MKLLTIFLLAFSFTIVSCGDSEDYIDINDVVDGNTGGGNSGDNGFTFNEVFYSTNNLFIQAEITLSFASNAQINNGGVIANVGDEVENGATISLGATCIINITADASNPADVEQYQSTGGTMNVTSIDRDAQTIILDYTIITDEGTANGKYSGGYTVQ